MTSSPKTAEFDLTAAQARCQEVVFPVLQRHLESLHPSLSLMTQYAHGFVDEHGARASDGSGKAIRPLLALMSARAVGAPDLVAVPGAVAVELVHTFSLVHDDIMDNDTVRRRRAATWRVFGVGPAILAGDAMHARATQVLIDLGSEDGYRATGRLNSTLLELVLGQAMDLAFEERPWTGPGRVTLREYRDLAGAKTGSLLGCALAIGATLAGAAPAVTEQLYLVGYHLGIAFQVIDDVLGISGATEVTGKPTMSDLRQGKKTFPILFTLDQGGRRAKELSRLLADQGVRSGDQALLARAVDLIDEGGGLRASFAEARARHGTAARHLADCSVEPSVEEELLALANVLLRRVS